MSINGVQNTLQTLQAVAAQAAGQNSSKGMTDNASATGFAGELRDSIRKVAEAQNKSAEKVKAFQMGEPGVELNEVMTDMQKAGISFQMAVQVRNKLVSAYKEVMNMPV